MGKHQSLTITIPEPCKEVWNEMLPENDGRFCVSCQQKVIDFSLMSDNEILRTLSTAGKGCCGRFETTQLDRLITPQTAPSRPFFPAALLVTLLGTTAPAMGNAREPNDTTASARAPLDVHIPDCFDGRVIDAATGEGVHGVTIALKGSSEGSISDQSGYFRFNIPDVHYRGECVFKVSSIGYDAIEFTLDSSYTQPYIINLNKAVNNLKEVNVLSYNHRTGRYTTGGIGIIRTSHKDTWWQRLTRIFRKKDKHHDD